MKRPQYYIGIDIASATFTSAVGCMNEQWQIVVKPAQFANEYEGFAKYLHWLQEHGVRPDNSVICMEATGVYNEILAHFLVVNRYQLAIEPPLKVKRAFKPEGHKSDPVDACQISEYAYRYWDELCIWAPRQELLEQIKSLLVTREQFVVEKTAHHNALLALKRKAVRTPLAEQAHEKAKDELKTHSQHLEAEIQRLIDQDPDFRNFVSLLITIPGVGMLLATHMLLAFQSAPEPVSPKCLAVLSVSTHNPYFNAYFQRKLLEGKPKKLIINNVANKLLKVMVAVVRSNTPFIPNYRSVNPGLLKKTLTMS